LSRSDRDGANRFDRIALNEVSLDDMFTTETQRAHRGFVQDAIFIRFSLRPPRLGGAISKQSPDL